MNGKSILLISDPILPVPPITYGGIERIVDFLATELADHGWDVTLACHPESSCPVPQIHFPRHDIQNTDRVRNFMTLVPDLLSGRYDVIHSFAHFDLLVPLWPLRKRLIQSFQAYPNWTAFSKRFKFIPKRDLHITTCGRHMVPRFTPIAPTRAIHNGLRLDKFDFVPQVLDDAPLVFLGRIEPIKGTHTAIDIAMATEHRLIIAGNRSSDPKIDAYFKEMVEPRLGERIQYVGPVNDAQKNELLGSAAAFLMPIEWDEPFGIVMVEALACGTPVIGTARGALPEIVEDGIHGKHCWTTAEMIEAILHLNDFSRQACRSHVERHFSAPWIASQYRSFYKELLASN